MKANAEPRLLSSLVCIDSGVVVSQHRLWSLFYEIKCKGMTIFIEFMLAFLFIYLQIFSAGNLEREEACGWCEQHAQLQNN